MISQTSLNKPRHKGAEWFSFTSSFNIGLVLITAAALGILLFYFQVTTQGDFLVKIKVSNPDTAYYFMNRFDSSFFYGFVMIQAIITAVMSFGFMFNKRASITYLSLPISRGKLFITKYLAGLILTFLPFVIYMIVMLFANIQVFGASKLLAQGFMLFICSGLVASFSAYSIASVICLLAGTMIEGMIFSTAVIFGPIFAAWTTTNVFQFFLHGNAFGARYAVLGRWAPGFDSLIFPYIPGGNFSWIVATNSINYGEPLNIPFWGEHFDGAVMMVVWLILSVFISYLGYRVIKRYKAENSGLHGTNKMLCLYGSFMVVYATFGLFITAVGSANSSLLCITLLINLAVFILCRFLFTLSIKETFSFAGLKQCAIVMGTVGLICLIGYMGLFGYSSYQPDFEDIMAVEITYAGAPDYIVGESREYGNYLSHFNNSRERQYSYTRDFNYLTYTSADDIKTVLELHKELINAKPRLLGNGKQYIEDTAKDTITYQVRITYMLEGGKRVKRQYKYVTAKSALALISLDKTDAVKELIGESLIALAEAPDLEPVLITDSLFGNEHKLDPADNENLFSAIAKDIETLSLESKYFPPDKAAAVISFPRLTPDGTYEKAVSVVSGNTVYIDGVPLKAVEENTMYSVSTAVQRLYITDDYVNTMAFLREKGLIAGKTNETDTIITMHIDRYLINSLIYPTQAMYFRSYESNKYDSSRARAIDKNDYEKILELSRSHYYIAEGGYLVNIQTAAGKWVSLFLPESDAPDYIRNTFK